ncbi:MAG: SGNH/GDSL hydrolase family protein, partial [Planctomycetota bacterium]
MTVTEESKLTRSTAAYEAEGGTANASFAALDRRARAGDPISVVFFGASLTWGASASDPQVTSYRGRMMQYLQTRYPHTPFRFHDAAIGGSGSALGLFRLQRDVLRHRPDLVFLDFTANDGLHSDSPHPLACYETILH